MRQKRRAYECELCGRTGPGNLFVIVFPGSDEGIVCKRCDKKLGDLVAVEEALAAARAKRRLRTVRS